MYEQAKPRPVGIDKQTSIDDGAKLGKNIYVGPFAVISRNAQIADDVQIHAQVFIGPNVTVEKEQSCIRVLKYTRTVK